MLRKYLVYVCLLLAAVAVTNSCVYFNTFYLARKNFNQAESTRKKDNRDKATGGEITSYTTAIKKASKVLSEHPNSGWVDDALFVIGKSFYYLGDYAKSERKFRELLSNFPNSKFAEESRFFLGKSRYRLDNYPMAREIFEELLTTSKNNDWRSEAVYLMGEMSASQKLNEKAIEYYQEFVISYKSDFRTREVYSKIGQLQFDSKSYDSAIVSFRHAAELSEDPKDKFDAKYKEGQSLYMIDSIRAGLKLFEELREEQQDSVNLGNILLRIAEGENLLGEERPAILSYFDVAETFEKRIESAEAYYRLGQIAQEAWGDLRVAKDMYEMAAKEQRGGDWRTLAGDKVADINKVETYLAAVSSDSATDVAESRYLLAELYRLELSRPDSALHEYEIILDKYSDSDLAPKAMLAMGWIYESEYHDTTKANSYYQRVLDNYPSSDVLPQAIKLLELEGAEPYENYPDRIYSLAENQFVDDNNLDSAKALFQRLIDEFPKSRLVPKAEFAIAKIQLQQFIPSDKKVVRPYVAPTAADSSAGERMDSTMTVDSLVVQITIDTLTSSSDSTLLKPAASDSILAPNPADSTSRISTPVTMPADSAQIDTLPRPVPADTSGAKVRLSDLMSKRQKSDLDSAKPVSTPDSLPPSIPNPKQPRDSIGPDGIPIDSMRVPQAPAKNDSLIRLTDLIDRNATQRQDTTGVLTKPDSMLARSDSTKGNVNASDTTLAAKGRSDSLKVNPAPVDTILIDSTMIWVFQGLAKKYAGTEIGDEALRLSQGGAVANRNQREGLQQQQQPSVAPTDSLAGRDSTKASDTDTLTDAQAAEQYLREEIDKWPLMDDEPSLIGEFTYPVEAATSKFEGRVVLKIKIVFDGKVSEVIFLKGSNIKSIDDQVEKALLETYFDPLKIDPLKIGNYFIYNYEIRLPEVYR